MFLYVPSTANKLYYFYFQDCKEIWNSKNYQSSTFLFTSNLNSSSLGRSNTVLPDPGYVTVRRTDTRTWYLGVGLVGTIFRRVNLMEPGESVLDTIFEEEESVEGAEDVEMLDVEEGELTEQISKTELGENSDVRVNQLNQESNQKNARHKKKKKKKNKRNRSITSGPNVTNINRFVLDVCKRLKERKSYLVYTAVGCLGISALKDLVKEVDAIQACGGQKTADGKRFRTGGGILWNIIRLRDPNAYKEIMKKGKEFEKQFKQPLLHGENKLGQQTDDSLKKITFSSADQIKHEPSDDMDPKSHEQSHFEQPSSVRKRTYVHERIRVPVMYDDLLGGDNDKVEPA